MKLSFRPVGLGRNARPVLGIRVAADYFFSMHAGAHPNNEVPQAVRAVEHFMSDRIENWQPATYVILGDYNRAPDALRLDNPPYNIFRQIAVPAVGATHYGAGQD